MGIKKPTRIIEKPRKVAFEHGMRMAIKCDNGLTYTVLELCTAVNISTTLFYRRMRNEGWNSKTMLTMPPERKKAKNRDYVMACPDGDLSKLSTISRAHNLSKIPAVTAIERQFMEMGVL